MVGDVFTLIAFLVFIYLLLWYETGFTMKDETPPPPPTDAMVKEQGDLYYYNDWRKCWQYLTDIRMVVEADETYFGVGMNSDVYNLSYTRCRFKIVMDKYSAEFDGKYCLCALDEQDHMIYFEDIENLKEER